MNKDGKRTISSVRKNSNHQTLSDLDSKTNTEVPNLHKNINLQEYIEYSKNLDLKGSGVIRIDDELHELFSRLNTKTNVSMSQLTSALLHDFAKMHSSDIKKLIKNKYL